VGQPEDWTQPGAFEVVPGVHRMPLPLPNDGLRAVNVYAVDDGTSLVLIDAGWALAESLRRLEQALGHVGRSLADVSRFLVTHAHRDHYTQAVTVRRLFGTRVSLGVGERGTVSWAADPSRRPLTTQIKQLRRCGAAALAGRLDEVTSAVERDVSDWEPPDDWLDGRTSLPLAGRELVAIPTPGHTAGHLVFTDAGRGLLFAGDHVLPHITPSIGFEPVPTELPLRSYLRSLALVRQLPDMRLLPAHGPVTGSVHARVDQLLDHHGARLDACQASVESGRRTAHEVAGTLSWTRRGRRFDELDVFNQMLATAETEVHLELLVAQGRLARSVPDGIVHYGSAG
jgi:glyoxylase-like metal-dependent hydrolase (beta-lactamase superfamily II)